MLFYPLLHDYPIFLTIEDMPHLSVNKNFIKKSTAGAVLIFGNFRDIFIYA